MMIAPFEGGSVAAGLRVLRRRRGGFKRRRYGGLNILSGHGVLLRLQVGVGVRGGTGVGRRHRLIHGLVLRLSGGRRRVLDYLPEAVLGRQPEPVRAFLLETSVLGRLSGPLCDAVTGRTDGQQMLEAIERANLFLAPLDEVRGWWRYHHLFADLLRARLQQQSPERVIPLHRNAGSWHEEHGPVDDAVNHALAAGDAVWAARMIERQVGHRYVPVWPWTLVAPIFRILPTRLLAPRKKSTRRT